MQLWDKNETGIWCLLKGSVYSRIKRSTTKRRSRPTSLVILVLYTYVTKSRAHKPLLLEQKHDFLAEPLGLYVVKTCFLHLFGRGSGHITLNFILKCSSLVSEFWTEQVYFQLTNSWKNWSNHYACSSFSGWKLKCLNKIQSISFSFRLLYIRAVKQTRSYRILYFI